LHRFVKSVNVSFCPKMDKHVKSVNDIVNVICFIVCLFTIGANVC